MDGWMRTRMPRLVGGRGRGWGDCDEGSGTMAGAMLVMAVAVLMGAAAAGGAVLIDAAKARGTADTAAVSAAQSLLQGNAEPCTVAGVIARTQHATLEACAVEDEDVQVTIRLPTTVPIVGSVRGSARAGPVSCESS